ncbi:MAG TPA: hypothetical protein VMN60_02965, partial [Longimicrobiales bacterium]|nr:hypothetical protein [Longimicrobiales bacterium]
MTTVAMRRARLLLSGALLLLLPLPLWAQVPASAAESSGFQRHTTHDEMTEFLVALRGGSSDMRLATYGESR